MNWVIAAPGAPPAHAQVYYLATPASKLGHERALELAERCLAALLDQGWFVYSPIAHHGRAHAFRQPSTLGGFEQYRELDLALIDLCYGLIFADIGLPSYESYGMWCEVQHAWRRGKRILRWQVESGALSFFTGDPWAAQGIVHSANNQHESN